MNITLLDLLGNWQWHPLTLVALFVLAGVYARGWHRLRHRGRAQLANAWRLIAFLSALLTLAAVLFSPLTVLRLSLFSAHALHHQFLTVIAPALFWLASPFPVMLWALPPRARQPVSRLFTAHSRFRQWLRPLTRPAVAWVLYTGTLWLLHSPDFHHATLHSPLFFRLTATFSFGTATLFWWHMVRAAPRIHRRFRLGFHIAYIVGAFFQNEALAIILVFAGQSFYAHYTAVPRPWGLSALDDQILGSTLLWLIGDLAYALVAIFTLARYFHREEKKPPLSPSDWAAGDKMLAPGWQK